MRIFKSISRIIIMSAVAATVIISAGIVAGAESTGDCTYTYSNGELTITGTGAMGDYANAKSPWYSYKNSIYKLVIESGVEHIGNYTFTNLDSITEVTIPDTVKSIGNSAFACCDKLEVVNFNASKCEIAGTSSTPPFAQCDALTTINIGNAVKYIPENAFSRCKKITSIDIPESVYHIGPHAFSACESLEDITLSDKLTELPEYAFYGCTSLTSVDVPALMTKIGNYAFYKCSGLTKMTIPAVVSQIGYGAFQDCINLHIITTSGSYAELVAKQYGISYTATGGTSGGTTEPELTATTNTNAEFLNGSLMLGVKFDQVLDGECVHMAFYNDANKVVNYYIVPVFAPLNNITLAVDADDVSSATYAKVFIWDSLDSCRPISAPETVILKK